MDEPPPKPMPEDLANFVKKIKNISVRYLNSQKPTDKDLEKWIMYPLFQPKQETLLENEKTDLLVVHVDTIRQLLMEYDKRIERDLEEERLKKGHRDTSYTTSYSYTAVENAHKQKSSLALSSDEDEEMEYGKRAKMDDYKQEKDSIRSSSKESLQLSSMMSIDGIDDLVSLQEHYNDDGSE